MIRVFIIDDEDIILQGLISLIDWNSLGFATPVSFTDPLQAMQAAHSDPPDLIITDVEMPGIDGLSLAEDLRKHCPDTMIAILSAYDRFEYVRRALHSGTIHYLLKPVNPRELIELLQTVKNRLNLKKEDAQKRLDQERALEEERRTVTALALQDMLCNDLTAKKTRESQIYRDLIRERVFWVVFIYIPYKLTKELEYLPPLQDKVREIMNEIGQKVVSKAFFHINFMPAIVLDAPPDLINISHIIDKLGILSDLKLLWQVYPICIDVNTAKQGFNEALSAFQRWIFLGDNRKTIDLNLSKLLDQSQAEMKRILLEGSPEDLKEAMRVILRELTAANVERLAASDFFIAILEYAASLETLHIGDERYQSHSIKIPTMFRISEYALYAEQILLDIQESIQNSLQNFGRNIIIEVKAYIEKNYSDPDLRLHKIAEIFFINYSYLSAIFKEETGESFSAYLTNIRLKEACRLLENTSLPVKEVAGRVGYSDPKYFYQVFRRNYGYAPGSMRDTSTRKKSPQN